MTDEDGSDRRAGRNAADKSKRSISVIPRAGSPPGQTWRVPDRWRRRLMLGALVILALSLFTPSPFPLPVTISETPIAEAATVPTGFQDSAIITGLEYPTAVRIASDGRVFISEKRGVIKVFDSLTDSTPTIFADLTTNVHNYADRGLVGIELHPNFPATPYVYALYSFDHQLGSSDPPPRWGTVGSSGDKCPNPPGISGCVISGRLSRLQADGNVMTGPEKVLLEDWCQQASTHSVGSVVFGPDGALYASGGEGASGGFVDYGQSGNPLNPCGDPPGGVGGTMRAPTAEGGALRSQDLRTPADPTGLSGSIVRIDPETGAALANNPLASSSDANARRIIAYGLRNPFRMAFRPGTSELWVADVGYNTWEEIDLLAGVQDGTVENFGWPCYEGAARQPGYEGAGLDICKNLYAEAGGHAAPYFTYGHGAKVSANDLCSPNGGSVTGMAFYSGTSYPAEYQDALFFADYSRGCIWYMPKGSDGRPDRVNVKTFLTRAAGPVDLQAGPNGDLFYVDLGGGTIHRVQYVGDGGAITCAAGLYSAQYFANTTLTGNPTTSRCEDAPLNYNWAGGGPAGAGVGVDRFSARWSGTFDLSGGTYTFTTIVDGGVRVYVDGTLVIDRWQDSRATYTATRQLNAGSHTVKVEYFENWGSAAVQVGWQAAGQTAPTATIVTPSSTSTWRVGDLVSFSGSATDPEDGELPASALSWSVILHHCPSTCHSHPMQEFTGTASGSFTAPDHGYPAHLELKLTARDSSGLTNVKSILPQPQTVDLTLQSNPAGLELTLNGEEAVTPFKRTVIVGSTNSLGAPSPQDQADTDYTFSLWSDGKAQAHDITAPGSPTTYTATYSSTGTPPPGGEQLVNPGFEDGLAGWDRPAWQANVADVTTTTFHAGARAFRFTGRQTGITLQQDVAARPERITFSGWFNVTARNPAMNGVVELLALNANRGTLATFPVQTFQAVTNGWVQMQATPTLPAGTTWVRVRVRFATLDGTVVIDDLSLRSASEP